MAVSSFAARKYLRVIIHIIPSGTVNSKITFNGDSGSNYSQKTSTDSGANTNNTSIAFIDLEVGSITAAEFAVIDIINMAAQEKIVNIETIKKVTAGAGTAPANDHIKGAWANTSNQITTISLAQTDTGDFNTGSSIVVLGHD